MNYKEWKHLKEAKSKRTRIGTAFRTAMYGPEGGFLGALGIGAGTVLGTAFGRSLIKNKGRKKWVKRLGKAHGWAGRNPYAVGALGALALGSVAAGGYKHWKQSQKIINKNKQSQKPRRK